MEKILLEDSDEYFEIIRILKTISSCQKYKQVILGTKPLPIKDEYMTISSETLHYDFIDYIYLYRRYNLLDKTLEDWQFINKFILNDLQYELLLEILEIDPENEEIVYDYDYFILDCSKATQYLIKLHNTSLWEKYLKYEKIIIEQEKRTREENRERYDDRRNRRFLLDNFY